MKPLRNLLLLLMLTSLTVTVPAAEKSAKTVRTRLLKIKLNEKEMRSLRGFDIKFATGLLDSFSFVVVTEAEKALLDERGFEFTELAQSENEVDLYKRALYGPDMKLDPVYHTYDEILAELKTLREKYPDLVYLRKIGRTTQEKRDIWAVKISDNAAAEEDEPAIQFSGAIHADEIAGPEICMALINFLLKNYGIDFTATHWVNANEIWVIPVINVDGHHVVTHNIDPRWRKNTRDLNGNGKLDYPADGIDLNRNFDFNWAHGGSSDSASVRYRGEMPFSEGECRAVRDLAAAQKPVLSVTYHSQGQVVFYPWDWRGRPAPDDELIQQLAHGLAGKIQTLKADTTYAAFPGAGTVGQTYPWLYGVNGTIDLVVETGEKWHIFPEVDLEKIVTANLQGVFFLLNQMNGSGLTGRVTDAETGQPLNAEVFLPDIDTEDISRRHADTRFGRFFRPLLPGTHRVIVSFPGYQPQVLKAAGLKWMCSWCR